MSTSSHRRRPSLGRGLDALFADDSDLAPVPVSGDASKPGAEIDDGSLRRGQTTLPIDSLSANPFQPRTYFDQDELDGLADSIRQQGILSPVIVREDPEEPGRYQIVAGERRWRAAQIAQLHDVPVIVRSLTDSDTAQIALLENIQRQDLDAIEEGTGYRCLIDQFGYTQDGLGRMLGKSRSHIANTLRLLDLPEAVLAHLKARSLSAGHARALLGHPDPEAGAIVVIEGGLTVRQTEALVKEAVASDDDQPTEAAANQGGSAGEKPYDPSTRPGVASDVTGGSGRPAGGAKDPDTIALEQELTSALGLRVSVDVSGAGESGRLTVHYTTLDQLDDVIRRIRS
jgi:ParB family transcriptional regulator, chromosome partitioning protein